MTDLLARLVAEADIVLLDAPPVTVATEALELATRVDGVLLTVRGGHPRRGDAQRAAAELAQVGARVLGAVLINAAA
jgi:Mrp family chromosome partitioning ATPase